MKTTRLADTWWELVITLAFFALIVAIDGCYNQVVYGDWTCLAKHCVVVK